jgi:hypothetical protein
MEIAGKYKNKILCRCCSLGKWNFGENVGHSFTVICKHIGYSTHTNGIDINKLNEVTDNNIINQAFEEKYKEEERVRNVIKEHLRNKKK